MAYNRKRSRAQSGSVQAAVGTTVNAPHAIPGLGTFQHGGLPIPPQPPPPQFLSQNGGMPAISVEQLNAYAASLPPGIWSHFANGLGQTMRLGPVATPDTPAPAPGPQQKSVKSLAATANAISTSQDAIVDTQNIGAAPTSQQKTKKHKKKKKDSQAKAVKPPKQSKASKQSQTGNTDSSTTTMAPMSNASLPPNPTTDMTATSPSIQEPSLQQRALVVLRDLDARGIRFEDVLRLGIGLDEITLLRELYHTAGLSLPPQTNTPAKAAAVQANVSKADNDTVSDRSTHGVLSTADGTKPTNKIVEGQSGAASTLASSNGKQTGPQTAAKKAPVQDRQAYLAKLEAIRAKSATRAVAPPAGLVVSARPPESAGAESKPALPIEDAQGSQQVKDVAVKHIASSQAGVTEQSLPAAGSSASVATPTTSSSPALKTSVALTEKLRQRLAALKQKKATAPSAESSPAIKLQASPKLQLEVSSAPLNGHKTSAPASPIPGLFMSTANIAAAEYPSIISTNAVNNPVAAARSVKKRPRAADLLDQDTVPTKKVTVTSDKAKGTKSVSEDDQIIIDLTDDSSDGEAMEIDAVKDTSSHVGSSRHRGSVEDISGSAQSLLGVGSPKAIAAQRLLEAREKAIVAMREKIKAREQQRKAAESNVAEVSTPKAATPLGEAVAEAKSSSLSAAVTPTPTLPGPATEEDVRRQRQAKIDADILQNNSKLEELQKEMQRLMAANQKAAEDKARLAKELENVGVDTDGMSHKEMQDTMNDIESAQANQADVALVDETKGTAQSVNETMRDEGSGSITQLASHREGEELQTEVTVPTTAAGDSVPEIVESSNIQATVIAASQDATSQLAAASSVSSPDSLESGELDEDEDEDQTNRQQDASTSGMSEDSQSDTSDGELSNAPERASTQYQLSADESSPSVESESDMSLDEAEDNDAADESTQDDDDDEYDPPAVVPGSIKADDHADAMDITTASLPALEEETPSSTSPAETLSSSKAGYQPYQSPLTMFKAYRFHPDYQKNVKGGFTSSTYSSIIDQHTPMCPTELSTGQCNDGACQFQHFKTMIMNDSEVLKELGIDFPFRDKTRLDEWRQGIREILQSIRVEGASDVTSVATKLLDFRRRFVGDDTRVLNLDI